MRDDRRGQPGHEDRTPYGEMVAATQAQPIDGALRGAVLAAIALGAALAVRDWSLAGRAAIGIALGAACSLVIALACRDRWRAEDVLAWHAAERDRAWIAHTGGPAPLERAEAEIWLGAHPEGQVPALERAIAAQRAGDPRAERMLAALPDATPGERVDRAWVAFVGGPATSGPATLGPATLGAGAGPIAADGFGGLAVPDRVRLASVAIMDAAAARASGSRTWLVPLLQTRAHVGRPAVGRPGALRYWTVRLRHPIGLGAEFAVAAFLLLPALTPGAATPSAGAQPSDAAWGTRGAAAVDPVPLRAALPEIERAVAAAVVVDTSLAPREVERLLAAGLPTVVWTPGSRQPVLPGAGGRRVYSVEICLGLDPPLAVVTFERSGGPVATYRLDPALRTTLLAAVGASGSPVGVPPGSPAP